MNRVLAEQILGITNESTINDEVVKKYFRVRASETHPDKFYTEPDKLKATQRFIMVKKAYDFINNYIKYNGPYKNISNDYTSDNANRLKINNSQNTERKSYESKEKKNWYSNFSILLFPGAYIISFLGFILYLVISEFRGDYRFYITHLLIILPIYIVFVILYAIYKEALDGGLFYQIILVQMVVTFVYYGGCHLYRRYLKRKYLGDINLN